MSTASDSRAEELAAIVREIRDRVRRQTPDGQAGNLTAPLPDLLPILHARDAAEGKAAAIGTVNPRPPGVLNNLVQSVKRLLARSTNWMFREQVEFNLASVECVQATLNALNDVNRVLAELASEVNRSHEESAAGREMHREWLDWRRDWELRLAQAEVRLLRGVAELSAAYEHRTTELATRMERQFESQVQQSSELNRAALAEQHRAFSAENARAADALQSSLRADFEKVRREYEAMIHQELRVLRQRAATPVAAIPAASPAGTQQPVPAELGFDYTRFADRFRGAEEYVRERQKLYTSIFAGRSQVLDIGCGRGEFLDAARAAGIEASGIDLDPESVAYCRAKGHAADQADLFEYLGGIPDASLDGIFSSQVIEHLPPERLPEMVRLCGAKMRREGIIALETPNPECLAIFATHFYIDPTHTRPVPPSLIAFYLEEFGFGGLEIRRLSPAIETMPSLGSLPADFREAFFGSLDYAAIARKL